MSFSIPNYNLGKYQSETCQNRQYQTYQQRLQQQEMNEVYPSGPHPLDCLIDELNFIILEYFPNSHCADAMPTRIQKKWYRDLAQRYQAMNVIHIHDAVCSNPVITNSNRIFCKEIAKNLHWFLQLHEMLPKSNEASDYYFQEQGNLEILPLIEIIQGMMDTDLCLMFQRFLSRQSLGSTANHNYDFSHLNLDFMDNENTTEKACAIRKWMNDQKNQSIIESINRISIGDPQYSLKTIPPEIYRFVNTTDLYLNKHEIRLIPAKINNFSNLENLYIAYNCKLIALPDDLGNLANIKRLDISITMIKQIPESIANLRKLNWITIGNMPSQSLPHGFFKRMRQGLRIDGVTRGSMEELAKKYDITFKTYNTAGGISQTKSVMICVIS